MDNKLLCENDRKNGPWEIKTRKKKTVLKAISRFL